MYNVHRVFGDKEKAVTDARTTAKVVPEIKLYETPSGKFIVTTDEHSDYREINYEKVSLTAIKQFDVETMDEVPMSQRTRLMQ